MIGAAATIALTALIGTGLASGGQPAPDASAQTSYREFMTLAPAQRTERFRNSSAEAKASLKRTHAQLWLEQHHHQLSGAQVQIVQEAIEFITPELYLNPEDKDSRSRDIAIGRKLACALGQQRATEAFMLVPPVAPPATGAPADRPAWKTLVDTWLTWFSECVIG